MDEIFTNYQEKMARFGIREVDAKRMYFESIGKNYTGVQIKTLQDTEVLDE
jgi:hypothetical protein